MIHYAGTKDNSLFKKEILREMLKLTQLKTAWEFEEYKIKSAQELSVRLGANDLLFTDSGTTALIVSLLCARVRENDEVITTSLTWVATSLAIRMIGAIPVYVDVDDHLTIDAAKLQSAVTKKTRVILPVHMFGHACNMKEILKIAKLNDLNVVEDACQGFLGKYEGKYLGTLGDYGALSFDSHKTISSMGAGGAVLTQHKENELREYLQTSPPYEKVLMARRASGKMSYSDIACVSAKLKVSKIILELKRKCLEKYIESLRDTVRIFEPRDNEFRIVQIFVIETDRRDELYEYLKNNGVITQKPFTLLKNTERASEHVRKGLYLPMPAMMTQSDVKIVCDLIIHFLSS